jgi:transposase InsO family protein
MKEKDVELVLQRAYERFPGVKPKIISDRGSQFIGKDFREFIRHLGLTHVVTSPGYPQSNGKIERFFKTTKVECIRRSSFLSIEDARRQMREYIWYYNHKRLHSAIDYVAPYDMLTGRRDEILKKRDEKLERARKMRFEIHNRKTTLSQNPDLSDSR